VSSACPIFDAWIPLDDHRLHHQGLVGGRSVSAQPLVTWCFDGLGIYLSALIDKQNLAPTVVIIYFWLALPSNHHCPSTHRPQMTHRRRTYTLLHPTFRPHINQINLGRIRMIVILSDSFFLKSKPFAAQPKRLCLHR
jgi:hypothetical protein